jgi:glutamate/tyrosine decarboxylase-like PLP-dependent enzyme
LEEISLDPPDWDDFRATAHAALDDAIDFLRTVNQRPVWEAVPQQVQQSLEAPLPVDERPLAEVYAEFKTAILPYATGNIHPRFFGWVHGAGQAGGIVAELLAAAMNANCGGRDHAGIRVEREVINWCKTIFQFPAEASGLLVSGTSMANLIGLGVARHEHTGGCVRRQGLKDYPGVLVAYASVEAHESVVKAAEILGLGAMGLRKIPVRPDLTMDVEALEEALAEDRRAGKQPFCVIASAGTVNSGAIDPLNPLASLCARENLWFHVDGAFAALGFLSEALRPRLEGLERADSLAFDFHKWAQVQYDAGCLLVRRGDVHRAAYAMSPPYLRRGKRGLAGGEDWPCDFGPELSRSFRALKVWFAFEEHGARKIGRIVEQNCAQAQYLADRIGREHELELMAPVSLNIVCFRFAGAGLPSEELDYLNEDIVADLQEGGIAAPSTTRIGERLAIRVNLTNHRTRRADLDVLVDAVLSAGRGHAAAGRQSA